MSRPSNPATPQPPAEQTHEPRDEPRGEARDEQRLMDLELKVTYLEDLCDRLNEVVIRQQDQVDRLMAAVQELSRQAASAEPGSFRSLRDELPPHY